MVKKKPTKSRKNMLIELYNSCKFEEEKLIEGLSSKSDSDLRSDRLYLYYTQMGRCMYSGESIDISKLFDKNIYDVDHIYPRSKIKDDSIGNRVLVKKEINAQKSDKYPLPREIQHMNIGFWKGLKDKGLIDNKKYERLIRTNEFSDDELVGFISRQIVETRQSTKAVAEVLKRVFDNSEIVYVKAGNVSEFRNQFNLVKVREINDYHHAKDAYLNIVVGNVFNTKFTRNPKNFIKNKNNKYNLNRMYDFDIFGKDITAWKTGDNGSISTVKSIMKKNNILFTRYSFEQKGSLFDQMILKKGKGQFSIKGNLKLCNIQKYGGYNKVSTSVFMLVEHTKNNNRIRSIEYVPVYLSQKFKDNNYYSIKYCREVLQLIEPEILIPMIKINTLFNIDGFLMHLTSRQNDQLVFQGGNQLCIGYSNEIYLKKVLKYVDRAKTLKGKLLITELDGITIKGNLEIYDLFLNKLKNTLYKIRLSSQIKTLENGREKFIQLQKEEQCKLLSYVLNLFKCNRVESDLNLIGGAKKAGNLTLSKNISNNECVKIINQSHTGVFSKEVNLLQYELENSGNQATS